MSMVLFSVSASSIVIESENKEQEAENSWKNYFCFTYDKSYSFTKKYRNQTIRNALIGLNFSQKQRQDNRSMFHKYKAVMPVPSMTIQLEDEKQEKEQSSYNNYFCFTYDKKYHFFKKHEDKEQAKQNALIGEHCMQRRHQDRWVCAYHKSLTFNFYIMIIHDLKNKKNDAVLLTMLNVCSIIGLTKEQTKYIYLKFLPQLFTNSYYGYLERSCIDFSKIVSYWMRRVNRNINWMRRVNRNINWMRRVNRNINNVSFRQAYATKKESFENNNRSGFVLKMLFHFYRYQPYIQKRLIKECFLLRNKNINFTYNYDYWCVHNVPKDMTILTFLLLNIKDELRKNHKEYITQLSSLFKFLVVECKAHLFVRDDNNYVPIMMIEEDKELKQIIENNFGKELLKKCIMEQLCERFCPCGDIHKQHCTNAMVDSIVNYDESCLRLILSYKEINFSKIDNAHFYDNISSHRPIRSGKVKRNDANPLKIALNFHEDALYSFVRAFDSSSPFSKYKGETLFIRNIILSYVGDINMSPYLPTLRMLAQKNNKERNIDLKNNADCLENIINLFRDDSYSYLDDTFKIIEDISEVVDGDQGFLYQNVLFEIESANIFHKDLIPVIINYYGYFYYSHLSKALKDKFYESIKDDFWLPIKTAEVKNFKKLTPEKSIMIEYFSIEELLKNENLVEKEKENLKERKSRAQLSYYMLLRMSGVISGVIKGYSETFNDHYALFLQTMIGEFKNELQ